MGVVRSKIKAILIRFGLSRILDLIKTYRWFQAWAAPLQNLPLPVKNYDIWIRSQLYESPSLTISSQKETIKQRVAIIFFEESNLSLSQTLKTLIHSLDTQLRYGWELTLIVQNASRELERIVARLQARGAIIRLVVSDKQKKHFSAKELMNVTNSEWVIFMRENIQFAPLALDEIVRAHEDLADIVYCDEDHLDLKLNLFFSPIFKPDWSPDTLRSYNYIGSLFSVKKKLLLEDVELFENFDDLLLQLTERATKIRHIPKVLAHVLGQWQRGDDGSFLNIFPPARKRDGKILARHLKRLHWSAEVLQDEQFPISQIRYALAKNPLVSIIIPNKDHLQDLQRCLGSIKTKSTYRDYEIIIAENNSTDPEIFNFYERAQREDSRVRVQKWSGSFNYSAVNNFAVRKSKGEYLLFLNNDIEVITPTWMEELLMYAMRPDVGIVGAKLYYPNETVQHAGVIIGMRGLAAHVSRTVDRKAPGYCYRLKTVQNLTAVTAACSMTKRKLFEDIGGFDEKLIVAFNDIDLCLKARAAGKVNILTPYAELFHYESLSRGTDDTPEKMLRFEGEVKHFFQKWDSVIKEGDPYYNTNLSLENEEVKLRT